MSWFTFELLCKQFLFHLKIEVFVLHVHLLQKNKNITVSLIAIIFLLVPQRCFKNEALNDCCKVKVKENDFEKNLKSASVVDGIELMCMYVGCALDSR